MGIFGHAASIPREVNIRFRIFRIRAILGIRCLKCNPISCVRRTLAVDAIFAGQGTPFDG